MLPILIVALLVGGPPTLYFALKSREFRKFLAAAFFVSAGVQFYFYLANLSIPLIGTSAPVALPAVVPSPWEGRIEPIQSNRRRVGPQGGTS